MSGDAPRSLGRASERPVLSFAPTSLRGDATDRADVSCRAGPARELAQATASLKELMRADAETRGRVEKLARDGMGVDVLGGALAA